MRPKYKNPYIHDIRRTAKDAILLFLGYYNDHQVLEPPPVDFIYPRPKMELVEQHPKVEWINHCTFLIEMDGVRILTDPIWSSRCSPCPWIGPKRNHSPPKTLEELAHIDIVLISHNHYDHLDKKTVKQLHKLYPNILWIVPKGVKSWFARRNITNVKEIGWWEERTIDRGKGKSQINIVGVPTQHNSGRSLFDMNKSLWLGYVVRFADKCFYFVGDTAYNPYDFKKIGRAFSKIDLCLCPIGTYTPGKFMRTVHSHPEDAVAIHQDVGAELSVAMHWYTFQLAYEPLLRPPYDLFLAMTKQGLNPQKFLPLAPGEVINW